MWTWIEKTFRYQDGVPVTETEAISEWLNDLESEKTSRVLALRLLTVDDDHIVAIAKIELPAISVEE